MSLYHFTSATHLPFIRHDGFLKAVESNVSITREHAGPDVVWLTDLPEVGRDEHGLRGSAVDKSEVRFTVDVPGVPWLDWSHAAVMDPVWRERFIGYGGGLEAARRWYVWPAAIPRRRWQAVHVRTSEGWVPVEM